MSENKTIRINNLPVPTWNHLKINDAEYETMASKEELFDQLKKIAVKPENQLPVVHDEVIEEATEGLDFEFTINTDSTIILRLLNKCEEKSDDSKKDIIVKINANIKEGLTLNLSIVNLTKGARIYVTSDALCNENSALRMTTISLGSSKAYFEGKAELKGDNSMFDSYTAYILNSGQFLDMNYVADHKGKNTEAEIVSSGVLNKGTEKVSRQTVNFISGCAGSKGAESEEVLLLDDDVISKSAPLILCTEEDVEGEHGASIGQPDIDVIFYLKSRGIAIEKIYEMLSFAKIEAALSRIDHEETSEMVRNYLGINN
ncbi:MAG: SufD family Fe-S cluster assembly protein [Lachnospiraceae bacterium]|nr:SufD family Fe-S cluster assembly protein [Lachnospiraceae bacterium]